MKLFLKGFTLLELLLVVASIAVLASLTIVAINPNETLAKTRNANRAADVRVILDAVMQYQIDNGSLPAGITATPTEVCKHTL